MEKCNTEYKKWLKYFEINDEDNYLNLKKMSQDDIADNFSGNVQFGTGGIRGIMAMGPNGINDYTIRKVTLAVCDFYAKKKNQGVIIAYDCRKNSYQFAIITANIFLSKGFKVYIFNKLTPVPILSYAINKIGAACGIMITASHNPKEFNGYKVYDHRGVQLLNKEADLITKIFNSVGIFNDAPIENELRECAQLTILEDEIISEYENYCINKLEEYTKGYKEKELKILYSPLYGTGFVHVKRVLSRLGFNNVTIIQEGPDSNFGNLSAPNPEFVDSFSEAVKIANKAHYDIIIATDPDCDRVGVLVKRGSAYYKLSGNEIAALFLDYIIKNSEYTNGGIITTIVSGGLATAISKGHDIDIEYVFTGFKYISDISYRWHTKHEKTFLLGYEESGGFLIGDQVFDKDGVISAALICLIADSEAFVGNDIYAKLQSLYNQYGYFLSDAASVDLPISRYREIVIEIMNVMRINPLHFFDQSIEYFDDYLYGTRKSIKDNCESKLNIDEKANVLKFYLTDEDWFAIRPSGTEPKVKIYFSIKDSGEARSKIKLQKIKKAVMEKIEDYLKEVN